VSLYSSNFVIFIALVSIIRLSHSASIESSIEDSSCKLNEAFDDDLWEFF
jgi:hypothetical protein